MIALLVLVAVVVAVGALMWWTVGQPPTRPRPDSRYRGTTYMSVHRRLRDRSKPPDGRG